MFWFKKIEELSLRMGKLEVENKSLNGKCAILEQKAKLLESYLDVEIKVIGIVPPKAQGPTFSLSWSAVYAYVKRNSTTKDKQEKPIK